MEAVNKVVHAASTAIWGENDPNANQSTQPHGEEPISGVQGKGAINDPYDAGNREGKWNDSLIFCVLIHLRRVLYLHLSSPFVGDWILSCSLWAGLSILLLRSRAGHTYNN